MQNFLHPQKWTAVGWWSLGVNFTFENTLNSVVVQYLMHSARKTYQSSPLDNPGAPLLAYLKNLQAQALDSTESHNGFHFATLITRNSAKLASSLGLCHRSFTTKDNEPTISRTIFNAQLYFGYELVLLGRSVNHLPATLNRTIEDAILVVITLRKLVRWREAPQRILKDID